MNTKSDRKLFFMCFLFLLATLGMRGQETTGFTRNTKFTDYDSGMDLVLDSGVGEDSFLIFDQGLGKLRDAIIEFDVEPRNSDSKFGFIARYISKDQWTYVGCDLTSDILGYSHWNLSGPNGEKQRIATEISKFYKDYKRHVLIKFIGGVVSIYIDGERMAHTSSSLLNEEYGHIGFRAYDGGAIKISDLEIRPARSINFRKGQPSPLKLVSEAMEVVFDKNYPTVNSYTLKHNGNVVLGARQVADGFLINGEAYRARTRSFKKGNSIVYQSDIDAIHVKITTEFSIDGSMLEMKVTDIVEEGDFRIKTLAFPQQDLISIKNTDKGAMLSIARGTTSDDFIALKDKAPDTAERYASIIILNNDSYALTVDSNSIYNAEQIAYRSYKIGKENYTSIYSNEWIYRDMNGDKLPLPEMKVLITGDINGDEYVDWQDAAYSLAKVYPEPYGAELLRNSYATISMNFASGAQYPFLRQLDNIKKFYLATDGFGQMIELKGYGSEGHDSAHPDYGGNYNERAGGLRDLQVLTQRAKDYNAHIGVHINHSESYPEAKAYDREIVSDVPGWRWLDQSYLINKRLDINRGTFNARLDQMKRDLPDLSFVYLDTYREHRTLAAHTAKTFIDHGWSIWTEEPNVFMKEASWIHYNPESKSMIHRFVAHRFRDGYEQHPLLLGGYNRSAPIGFMGWQKGRDFNGVLHNFFTQQLPYRYLMKSSLKSITGNGALFEDNKVSSSVNGVNLIHQDGALVKSGDLIFIPWNTEKEDKVYHYNPQGGRTVWTLPKMWHGQERVKLYELSPQGRSGVLDIPVTADNEIVIDAKPRQGYVIYGEGATPLNVVAWGEYGLIKNPGFDGGLEHWTIDGGPITTRSTQYGQDVLQISGSGQVDQDLDLIKGRHYILSVWAEVNGNGKTTLRIGNVSYSIRESLTTNFTDNTDRYNTKFQRIKLPFTYQGGASVVSMSFEADTEGAYALFDDVRMVEQSPTDKKGYAYYEDFEHVDEGWGPFIASKASAYTTHLSELHEGYTDDTLDGRFSLKTWREGNGEVYRTSPSMIQFYPNKSYRVKFDYKSDNKGVYRIVIRSKKDNTEVLNEPLDAGNRAVFESEFRTGTQDDYYICLLKEGDGILVLDNFALEGDLRDR